MTFKIKHKKILVGAIVVFIIAVVVFTASIDSPCSTVNAVDTSIRVVTDNRAVIGFNTDTDSLKFGRLSSGASVKRSIEVNYKKKANVNVLINGDFAHWIKPTPYDFEIAPGKIEKVNFEVFVPENAQTGNYTGKVYFCFQDLEE
jgi:hypothetical protein